MAVRLLREKKNWKVHNIRQDNIKPYANIPERHVGWGMGGVSHLSSKQRYPEETELRKGKGWER